MTHTAECQAKADQNQAEIDAWKAAWPNHCAACAGHGGFAVSYNPSPAGVALGSGSIQDFDPCEECSDNGLCPRCGVQAWKEDDEAFGEKCAACGWTSKVGGCPHPVECLCWSTPPLPKFPERVAQVLAILCGEAPPAELLRSWLAHEQPTEADNLQDWAASHLRVEWAMGITVIEAAISIASQPNEELIGEVERATLEATGEPLPYLWWKK